MMAESLYNRFSQPAKKRGEFDWGLFVAPLFASPVVFILLMESLQTSNLDLATLDKARLMLFLVAFENGFLW